MRAAVMRIVALLLAAVLPGIASSAAMAQQPRLGMKLELMSIRTRSGSPVPVRLRLEYNEPTYLEGTLELQIYDALEFPEESDRIATIHREGIVLAGADYETILLLPPLETSDARNWAVRAWFRPENGDRIALSSVPELRDPAEPFDLLLTSSLERCFLMCSVGDQPPATQIDPEREYLEERLLLESLEEDWTRTVNHCVQWDIRVFSEDPITHCAFDVILLQSGVLRKMSDGQLQGLRTWLFAGGSLCICERNAVTGRELQFLRDVLRDGLQQDSDLLLDADGQLLLPDPDQTGILMARRELGRVVLLTGEQDYRQQLADRDVAHSVIRFLWKVRQDYQPGGDEDDSPQALLRALRRYFPDAEIDEYGIRVSDSFNRRSILNRTQMGLSFVMINGSYYLDPGRLPRLRQVTQIGQQLWPRESELLAVAERDLLPRDIRMVPVSVIALIMLGYVLAVGPLDYQVLGRFRCRRYTWFLFPIVTAVFTVITVQVAQKYLSSKDTGGELVITDLGENGQLLRQTRLETLFYGSGTTVRNDYRRSLLAQAGNASAIDDFVNFRLTTPSLVARDQPLFYRGNPPQSFSADQSVRQWSPVTLRSLTFSPDVAELPSVPWDDVSLVSTEEGRVRLRELLTSMSQSEPGEYLSYLDINGERSWLKQQGTEISSWALPLISAIPAGNDSQPGVSAIIAQFSPQGGSTLEDLSMADPTDETECVLVVARVQRQTVEVFRRKYLLAEALPPLGSRAASGTGAVADGDAR